MRGGRLGAGEGCRGRAVPDGSAQAVLGRRPLELGEQVARERAVAGADGADDGDRAARPRARRRRRDEHGAVRAERHERRAVRDRNEGAGDAQHLAGEVACAVEFGARELRELLVVGLDEVGGGVRDDRAAAPARRCRRR